MEALLSNITHIPEILVAVISVLGGQKGYDLYKKRKFHSGGSDRRSGQNHNSFSAGDKDFVRECFKIQTKEMSSSIENDRLKLVMALSGVIREEGSKTRSAMRSISESK